MSADTTAVEHPFNQEMYDDIQVNEIDKLAGQLLQMEIDLNCNIPTTLWISDLHGEGDRFKSILRGRFGLLAAGQQAHRIQHLSHFTGPRRLKRARLGVRVLLQGRTMNKPLCMGFSHARIIAVSKHLANHFGNPRHRLRSPLKKS